MAPSNEIKTLTPSLNFLVQLLSMFNTKAIEIPAQYRQKVIAVKKLFEDDPSGLTNTILDFAITCASVNYRIEVEDNDDLEKILNEWLRQINRGLIGKIPIGLAALAKEYFRERWKGSSNLLLRSFWEDTNNLFLPTTLFFVDGKDIKIKTSGPDKIVRLGSEKYYLRVDENESNDIPLPKEEDEYIFSQLPYEDWGTKETVPFLIRRGVYRNSKFLQLMTEKGEQIVAKALEYLMLMKKGTEKLFIEGNVSYNKEDLQKINQDLIDIVNRKKSEDGFASYATQFDTSIEHLIPEYTKAVNPDLYSGMEKRILAGLGLVEIVEGVASTRREGILNPKPLVGEINQGIRDFKSLLNDIVQLIIEKNKLRHPKWMNAEIRVTSSPVTQFMSDKSRDLLRGLYDRGVLSKRTLVEIVGDLDFDLETQRREDEKQKGHDKLMFAPVIQNQGEKPGQVPSKTGPEAKNFTRASVELAKQLICKKCQHQFEIDVESDTTSIDCPGCGETFSYPDEFEESKLEYEEAPYKNNKDLPFKNLPSGAKTIFRKTFNSVLTSTGDENQARQAAWRNVKLRYKKVGEEWVKKSKGELEQSLRELDSAALEEILKLEILGKQNKLLDHLLESKEEPKDEAVQ